MRILVTGASGLLGLNLALEASRQHTVFGTIKDHALQKTPFEVLRADLTSPGAIEQVLEQSQPDWVIHCAALAVLDACEADPDLARQLNSEVPGKLAEHVARGGARLVHISTDAVFDGLRGGYDETDEPNPLSVYARTKLDGEKAVAQANPQAIVARVNLFGWSLSGRRSLAEWFFSNLSAGRQVMGFTDVYFCPLLANDLAWLLLVMLEKDLHGLYHVVARNCISKHDFGLTVAGRFGFDQKLIIPTLVEHSGLQAARSPNLTLKTEKLTADLGFEPASISSGLDRFYSLYSEDYPARLRAMAAEQE